MVLLRTHHGASIVILCQHSNSFDLDGRIRISKTRRLENEEFVDEPRTTLYVKGHAMRVCPPRIAWVWVLCRAAGLLPDVKGAVMGEAVAGCRAVS